METGDRRLDPAIARGARLARRQAGARGCRRLGGGAARPAARRLGLSIREPALPRCRRHRRRRPGARPLRPRALARLPSSRAAEWIVGMQSRNGGWGSFDADNTHYYLNHIPFADHGALLDPPTADVSARCLGLLAQPGDARAMPALAAALAYLRREQEADGSWFGRWGTNYIYGTWSALAGPQRRRPRSRGTRNAPRRRVALRPPAPRWRLGRERATCYWPGRRMARRPTAPPRRPPGPCSA